MFLCKKLRHKERNKLPVECNTVICVDTSLSTRANYRYFEKIKSILQSEKNKVVISWNSTATIKKSDKFFCNAGTKPQTFLNIIKDFKFNYNLIVTTDGQIGDADVRACKAIIESSDLLNRIKSFKIYFIGNTRQMNLRISSPFNKLKNKQIIYK